MYSWIWYAARAELNVTPDINQSVGSRISCYGAMKEKISHGELLASSMFGMFYVTLSFVDLSFITFALGELDRGVSAAVSFVDWRTVPLTVIIYSGSFQQNDFLQYIILASLLPLPFILVQEFQVIFFYFQSFLSVLGCIHFSASPPMHDCSSFS